MGTNSNTSDWDQIIHSLNEMEKKLDGQIDQAEQMLGDARAAQRRVKATMTAAGMVSAAEKPTKGKKKPASEGLQRRILALIYDHIRTRESVVPGVPGAFTTPSLIAMTDLHQSSVNTGIRALRDAGRIRAVGTVPAKHGYPPTAYALVEETPS